MFCSSSSISQSVIEEITVIGQPTGGLNYFNYFDYVTIGYTPSGEPTYTPTAPGGAPLPAPQSEMEEEEEEQNQCVTETRISANHANCIANSAGELAADISDCAVNPQISIVIYGQTVFEYSTPESQEDCRETARSTREARDARCDETRALTRAQNEVNGCGG